MYIYIYVCVCVCLCVCLCVCVCVFVLKCNTVTYGFVLITQLLLTVIYIQQLSLTFYRLELRNIPL